MIECRSFVIERQVGVGPALARDALGWAQFGASGERDLSSPWSVTVEGGRVSLGAETPVPGAPSPGWAAPSSGSGAPSPGSGVPSPGSWAWRTRGALRASRGPWAVPVELELGAWSQDESYLILRPDRHRRLPVRLRTRRGARRYFALAHACLQVLTQEMERWTAAGEAGRRSARDRWASPPAGQPVAELGAEGERGRSKTPESGGANPARA
jgi:hypothetical protein